MATLVACCSISTGAESFSDLPNTGNVGRRLQTQKAAEAATHFLSGQVDDQLLKKAAKLVNAAKGDEAAVKKAVDLAALAKATAKVSDDEAVMISDLVKQARGDEAHAMRFILGTSQKEGKKITDESTALVSANIAQAVTKNRKSWPRLKTFAKIIMGLLSVDLPSTVLTNFCLTKTHKPAWPIRRRQGRVAPDHGVNALAKGYLRLGSYTLIKIKQRVSISPG
ncbi:hypothetical protein GN958_ATG01648 [Phytophthora infestans]|uniref:Secreted RxLR effector peptide protein n=1 Tax=Phytophthora infestans TaxID=4787 RepID=A0A8S9VAA6_PHYIN|nr:hypothetical protein GN958_ATG01648 [Phytophthora infestans]